MIQLLISLFFFEITVANQETRELKYLEFGYNDCATISINISQVKYPFFFGLATKKELGNLSYSSGYDQYAQIQFNVTRDTNKIIEINSKEILTPYSMTFHHSYDENSYLLQIDINNGQNHHDSRTDASIICTFVFSVLFSVIFIGSNIYFFFYQKMNYMFYFCFDLLVITVTIECVFALLSFHSFDENEFLLIYIKKYSGSYKSKVFMYQFAALFCSNIQLLLIAFINLILYRKSPYRLQIFDKIFAPIIYLFLILGLLCVVTYFQFIQTESFVYSTAFYFFFVFVFYFISNKACFSSVAIALFVFVKFLTFSVKYTGIILSMNTEGINSLFFSLNYVNLAFQFASIILFLIGDIIFLDFDKEPSEIGDDDIIDNNNPNTNELFTNSILYKPESARLNFDENVNRDDEAKQQNNEENKNESENNYSTFLYQ